MWTSFVDFWMLEFQSKHIQISKMNSKEVMSCLCLLKMELSKKWISALFFFIFVVSLPRNEWEMYYNYTNEWIPWIQAHYEQNNNH